MATDKKELSVYKDGTKRPYFVKAENVNLGTKENPEFLPEKLGEIDEALGNAVTAVKVGETTYEPTDGVVDISPAIPDTSGKANKSEMSVVAGTGTNADKTTITLKEGTSATVLTQHQDISGKVDKNGTDSLMTAAEHTKLQNLPTADQLDQQLGNKANDNAVVKSISVNGGEAQTPQQGNVNIVVPSGGLTKSDISVETQGDGTVDINVADDNYTINLNHTHADMAKIVKCTEATLPQTLENDTIYVQVDNATTPSEIESLWLFGLEFTGSGVPSGTPFISKPSGTTINLGTNYGSGVSAQVEIRGRDLTGDLTVTVGTGLTVSYGQTTNASSVTIPIANAMAGAMVTIAYSGSGALDDGSLVISGGGAMAKSVAVVVVEGWEEVDLSQLTSIKYWTGSADMSYGADAQRSVILDATNIDSIKIASQSDKKAFCVLCRVVPTTSTSNINYSSVVCSGETGRREIAANSVEVISMPADCVCVVIGMRSSGNVDNYAPQNVWKR